MHWSDDGIVLSARKHGEHAVIVQLLTRAHGRHAGLVRGGAGKRARGIYQPGNRVAANWRARLADHLGSFQCEPSGAATTALLLEAPTRLAALSAACAMAEGALPEREPHPAAFTGLTALLDTLTAAPDDPTAGWAADYVRWELELLGEIGYGLDLGACAATGETDDLAWVSPKSGRAVSAAAGEPYQNKLLPLPGFLIGAGVPGLSGIGDGLALTGYFLERYVFAPHDRRLPAARRRFAGRFAAKD